MTKASLQTACCVALVGNPNTGKSTLFSALAGVRQRTGNYPGVTVEKKVGHAIVDGQAFEFVDLPGAYSLAPRSLDEMVTVDVLVGRQPHERPIDCVVSVVDASNLERNLYLVSQTLAIGKPVVVALNMIDLARARGLEIDAAKLSERLGAPVVPIQANERRGLDALRAAILRAVAQPTPVPADPFPEAFRREVDGLAEALGEIVRSRPRDAPPASDAPATASLPRYLVERLLLDTSDYIEGHLFNGQREQVAPLVRSARERLAEAGAPTPAIEAMSRYEWLARALEGVVTRPATRRVTPTDRIDRVLTHKVWGMLVFGLMMLVVFTAVFVVAAPAMDAISDGVEAVAQAIESRMSAGALRSMVVQGALAGVGGVLVFLPQILILFFFIAVLEDCGYMARAAYLMDRLMTPLGLSGKSFIPLLSSFACAVPAIMATRVLEHRRDRLATILVAPLMSCSARLPVYAILIQAFVPERSWLFGLVRLQGLTLLAMYLVGVVVAAGVALALRRTLLRGPTPPFVLELPTYKWPQAGVVVGRMLERGWSFVYRAGTLILAVTILVWAAGYFPHDRDQVEAPFDARRAELNAKLAATPPADALAREAIEAQLATLDNETLAAYQRQSFLGRAGQWIEPVVRPLGWDWRIGSAVIASFPAREVVVGVLGVIYDLGRKLDAEADEDRSRLVGQLRDARWDDTGAPVYNLPVALSIMVFFALCCQCASTLAVIRRETNSWGWPAFTFAYMTGLAYLGSLAVYQIGRLVLPV